MLDNTDTKLKRVEESNGQTQKFIKGDLIINDPIAGFHGFHLERTVNLNLTRDDVYIR